MGQHEKCIVVPVSRVCDVFQYLHDGFYCGHLKVTKTLNKVPEEL